jgi:hypothetical protein
MDYEKARQRTSKIELGKRFLVKTDIANCFPSVYSHALPWATVGLAIGMANTTPDGSILKYAIKSLLGRKMHLGTELSLLPQMMALAYHQPALLPALSGILQRTSVVFGTSWGSDMHSLAKENARLCRSDGLLWALYYLNRHKIPISKDLASEALDCKDCLSLWLLYKSGVVKHQSRVVDFAKNLDATDNYELDQYWVLLYQLYLEKKINNPYPSEDAFLSLKTSGVSFSC